MESVSAFDVRVRRVVYDLTLRTGRPPSSAATAADLGASHDDVAAAFERLHAGRVLVLQPDGREILMAGPFSAVPTPFAVECDGLRAYGNCAWDALGIFAMRGVGGRIEASCGCCGAAITVQVAAAAAAVAGDAIVHFALPAARWWQDIAFT